MNSSEMNSNNLNSSGPVSRQRNLYLIGYRGSGKTTVAPLIAKLLSRDVVDADDAIEAKANMSIAEIFSKHGESDFRQRESEIISEIANRAGQVVSLGGGAPMFEANRESIAESGKAVYLSADFEILWQRISSDSSTADRRPNLTNKGGRAEVEELVAKRHPVYEACADYTIDVGDLTPEEIAQRIVIWFESVDKEE